MDGRKATLIVEEGKTIPLHNDEVQVSIAIKL